MNRYRTRDYEVIDKEREIRGGMIRICSLAYEKNLAFFGKRPPFFRIYILHTEEGFRKMAGRFYKPWIKGVSREGRRIIFRGPDLFMASYRRHGGTRDPGLLMTHEMNHIFASSLNMYRGPYWMTEGLAMYVAGQRPGGDYKPAKSPARDRPGRLLFYRLEFSKLCPEMYIVGYHCIDYLIKRFGKGRLLRLIRSYTRKMRKADFEKAFRRAFGISYGPFLEDFLSRYCK